MENIQRTQDIIGFLKDHPYQGSVFRMRHGAAYPKALVNRILAAYGFIKGYFTFGEFLKLLLPARFKSELLRAKFSSFINSEIDHSARKHIIACMNADGSVSMYGKKFFPAQGDFGEMVLLLDQVIVLDQYEASRYIKDGAVVIDAGANIGSFSVFSANLGKNVTVYSFEPVKTTYEALKRNAAAYDTIHCFNAGLGESNRLQTIYYDEGSSVGSAFVDRGDEEHHRADMLSQEAQITSIDDFVRKNNIPKVDFIKMDTEGYERKILAGAEETIKKFHPVISMSAYHKDDDKEVLPAMVKAISPAYDYRLNQADEEDLVFFPKQA